MSGAGSPAPRMSMIPGDWRLNGHVPAALRFAECSFFLTGSAVLDHAALNFSAGLSIRRHVWIADRNQPARRRGHGRSTGGRRRLRRPLQPLPCGRVERMAAGLGKRLPLAFVEIASDGKTRGTAQKSAKGRALCLVLENSRADDRTEDRTDDRSRAFVVCRTVWTGGATGQQKRRRQCGSQYGFGPHFAPQQLQWSSKTLTTIGLRLKSPATGGYLYCEAHIPFNAARALSCN